MNPSRRRTVAAYLLACGLAVGGCSTALVQPRPGTLLVTTSMYPLMYAAQQVGGDHVTVVSLAKPGVDAHDVEPTPQDVVTVSRSTVVVYERGFQSAIDQVVTGEHAPALDVAPVADLRDGNGHFWLDPIRMIAVVTAIRDDLSQRDPANAAAYHANASAFIDRLTAMDTAYRVGLAHCTSRDVVTGHAAFGYVAARYHLRMSAIAGLSPEAEPDARTLGELTAYVRDHHVTTVYAEPLTSAALTDTLASETGARVALLDPAETLTSASVGASYEEIMMRNLQTLRSGLGCT